MIHSHQRGKPKRRTQGTRVPKARNQPQASSGRQPEILVAESYAYSKNFQRGHYSAAITASDIGGPFTVIVSGPGLETAGMEFGTSEAAEYYAHHRLDELLPLGVSREIEGPPVENPPKLIALRADVHGYAKRLRLPGKVLQREDGMIVYASKEGDRWAVQELSTDAEESKGLLRVMASQMANPGLIEPVIAGASAGTAVALTNRALSKANAAGEWSGDFAVQRAGYGQMGGWITSRVYKTIQSADKEAKTWSKDENIETRVIHRVFGDVLRSYDNGKRQKFLEGSRKANPDAYSDSERNPENFQIGDFVTTSKPVRSFSGGYGMRMAWFRPGDVGTIMGFDADGSAIIDFIQTFPGGRRDDPGDDATWRVSVPKRFIQHTRRHTRNPDAYSDSERNPENFQIGDFVTTSKPVRSFSGGYGMRMAWFRPGDVGTIMGFDADGSAIIDFIQTFPGGRRDDPGDDATWRVSVPKRFIQHTRRHTRNPDAYPDSERAAATFFEKFHGRPAEEIVTVPEEEHYHEYLGGIGDLVEIKVKTKSGYKVDLDFAGDNVMVAASEDGRQLYLTGGNQKLELKTLHMDGKQWRKDLMNIGAIEELTYRTEKSFDENETTDYFHKLSEVTKGPMPDLLYDTLNDRLQIAGGQYHIPLPMIGVSPGIVN